MTPQRFLICTLLLIAFASCKATFTVNEKAIINNSNIDKFKELVKKEQFEIYDKRKYIPRQIKRAMFSYGGYFRIAKKGGRYDEKTDFIKGVRSLRPSRQLIMVAKSQNIVILTYIHNFGRGEHGDLVVVQMKGNEIIDLWKGIVSHKADSPMMVLEWMENYIPLEVHF